MLNKISVSAVSIGRRWGIHILVVGMVAFLILLVHRKIYEHFQQDERYFINLDNLQVVAPPDWLTDPIMEQTIAASLKMDCETTIFDKNLVNRLKEHFQNNPWVAQVHIIEKRLPNQLKIKLDLRRPMVAISGSNKDIGRQVYYLVDKDLVRLPGEYNAVPSLPRALPVVVGVRKAPPLPGKLWQDSGLEGALAVVDVLKKQLTPGLTAKLALASIDVSNINGQIDKRESEIVLWTQNRVPIQWGRAPGTMKFAELSAEEKINNLKLVLDIAPGLQDLKYVKIQFKQPYIALK
jgi:hypothetical protein